MAENREWDLPGSLKEYACVNCGDRFWINLTVNSLKALANCLYPIYQN